MGILPSKLTNHIRSRALAFLGAVVAGTALAFLISLSRRLINPVYGVVKPYLLPLPSQTLDQVLILLASLGLIALLTKLPLKLFRSIKLGLIPFDNWVWTSAVVVFWVAYDFHHARLAWGSIALAGLLTLAGDLVSRDSTKVGPKQLSLIESDLPVPEGGEDLLGRREFIDGLVSAILLEQPTVLAVTGGYGDGKTSVLNLTTGELRKLQGDELPVIVRFNPWLAQNSNALVFALLNSVVTEIKRNFVVPGLGRDAAQYARALVSVIPKTERLKQLIAEPSQEKRIEVLARHIAGTRRRVLVILDDLDRLEADELETVFKFLRGSDKLSNITFLCSFQKAEIALILKAARPHQNTDTFIEKFFPVQFPLPEVDHALYRDLLSKKIASIVSRYPPPPHEDLSKSLERIWEGGAGQYFENLRRIKLFLNRITYSLERIAGEVNTEDFIRLELIREIAPKLYEQIYRNPEYFWNRDFAFEVAFQGPSPLDDQKAAKVRAAFYDQLKASVPVDKHYVFQLLEDLFPHFATYRQRYLSKTISSEEAERDRRIFHPRCFRQYFLLKVPSELFSRTEFTQFESSIQRLVEDEVARAFSAKFKFLIKEDFKRWHFMHLIRNAFDGFKLGVARGLCRGMAQSSSIWTTDAFELMIAIACTYKTLTKIVDSADRQEFLRFIVRESASDLYTLTLFWRLQGMEEPPPAQLLSDLVGIGSFVKQQLRAHYLKSDAPSVFEHFGSMDSNANRIEPNQFLFYWRRLGSDAEVDQRKYLLDLFTRRPQDLDKFLKLMFRIEFIDDYSALKPLIDYTELAELIKQNESILDAAKVRQFRERYNAEQAAPQLSSPENHIPESPDPGDGPKST